MKTLRLLLTCLLIALPQRFAAQPLPVETPGAAGAADASIADALLKQYQSAGDPREAQEVFTRIRSAAATSASAAYVCGALAAQGGSVVADRGVAMQCFEAAAARGHAQAQHRLALLLIETADDTQRARAEQLLSRSAEALPESVYLLALLRAGAQPDADAARRRVVEKAAAAGYAPAQYERARQLFASGSAAGKAEARELLEKAAANQHGEAAAELALLIEAEQREQDIPRIVALLETASKAGSPRGDHALALRYAEAAGVKRDTERAYALIRRSAAAGHLPSQYTLGFFLSHGIGTPSDDRAALAWFRQVADRGHAEAQVAVANAYANGWGVGKSMDLAYRWYCKAAQSGSDVARAMVERAVSKSECELPDRVPAHRQPPGVPATDGPR